MKNSLKTNKINNKISSLKKNGKRNYAVLSGTIFAIVVLHFAFQFSFIQSENFRILQNLTSLGEFGETAKIAENTSVPEITETDDEKVNEKAAVKIKRAKVVKKRQISKPIKKRTTITPKRNSVNKKAPQPETRAERLRRAEKILTGA